MVLEEAVTNNASVQGAPLFSIVIPAFNRERELPAAIDSVMAQECTDWELIVVDDGSSDATSNVVKKIHDPRIRYLHQQNGGASRARNTGIYHARGRYIAFLDSDDRYLPHHLQQALPRLEQSNECCVFTQVVVDRGNGVTFLKPPRGQRHGEPLSEYLLCDRGFVQTSSVIVPALLARKVMYDESLAFGDDKDFALRLAQAGGRLVMLPEPGVVWMDHASESRLSSSWDLRERQQWLDRVQPALTRRAYLGDVGWHIAKCHVQQGGYWAALKCYSRALLNRCYSPKMAVVIFLQVFLGSKCYRRLSDVLASIGIRP